MFIRCPPNMEGNLYVHFMFVVVKCFLRRTRLVKLNKVHCLSNYHGKLFCLVLLGGHFIPSHAIMHYEFKKERDT